MFAPGPRAVGFTIVWPEGVIFRPMMTYHVQFLLLVLAGWVNRQQQDVIDYLQEENRVLRAGLRGKRLRLYDDRRRLAALVHNSDRGRELAWPRLPSSDHLAIRHPERRHGVENLAPDPCLDSLCRQPVPSIYLSARTELD